jgi:hypothetical protein
MYRQEIKVLVTSHLNLVELKASLFRKKIILKKIFEFIRITNVSPLHREAHRKDTGSPIARRVGSL